MRRGTALAAVRAALARPPKLRCAPSKIAGAGLGAFAAEPISEGVLGRQRRSYGTPPQAVGFDRLPPPQPVGRDGPGEA